MLWDLGHDFDLQGQIFVFYQLYLPFRGHSRGRAEIQQHLYSLVEHHQREGIICIICNCICIVCNSIPSLNIINEKVLSSLRAESARAVTGRRCPHSGKGEDLLTGQPDFFTETAVTPERKVEKSFPRWEINRHVEG